MIMRVSVAYENMLVVWLLQFDMYTSHPYKDATLSFAQISYEISENGGSVDVCVEISDVPTGGVECDITVYLASSDGAKAGKL